MEYKIIRMISEVNLLLKNGKISDCELALYEAEKLMNLKINRKFSIKQLVRLVNLLE